MNGKHIEILKNLAKAVQIFRKKMLLQLFHA